MIPVILSGGSGTRLWPVSRDSYPKQFCEFFDQSFLRDSLERVREHGAPWIVTLSSMAQLTKRTLLDSGFNPDFVVLEPMAKNTAPAIALMCHVLKMKGLENEIIGIFPADHFISKPEVLSAALKIAVKEAGKKKIVTLGIEPSYAATGYGYIELDANSPHIEKLTSFGVRAFVEKPNKTEALRMISEGHYFWNAGLFVFRADHMIELFQKYLPEVWSKVSEIKSDFSNAAYVYANVQPISLDYGIMEKTKEILCIPCDPGWSDVGSWDEVARLSEEVSTDSQAQVFLSQSENNFVYSTRPKVIGLANVEGLIVVDTPDALLVTRKGESQQVKQLVEKMRTEKVSETSSHFFSLAKWGRTEFIDETPDQKISKLILDGRAVAELSPATYLMVSGSVEMNGKSFGPHSSFVLERACSVTNIETTFAILIEVAQKKDLT